MSAFTSSGIFASPSSGHSRRKLSSLAMNTLPGLMPWGLMQMATNCKTPMRLCVCFFDADVFDSQHCKSLCNCCSLSGATSSTILSVSIIMPKKTIHDPGWHACLDGLDGPTIPDDFSKLQESCGGSPLHLYSSEIIRVVGDVDAIFLCYIGNCDGDALPQICLGAKANCQG